MNKVLHVDQGSKLVTVESGITIWQLKEELIAHGLSLKCLPQVGQQGYEEATLAQVVADDAFCVESRTKGFFKDSGGVQRVSFFDGSGESIQSGGYSSSARTQFGIDSSDVLFGTNHNLGIPYELVLQAQPRHEIENQKYIYYTKQFAGFE